MAIPWYFSEFPLRPPPESDRDIFSLPVDKNFSQPTSPTGPHTTPINNKKLISLNSLRNLFGKTNDLFKLPEREIDKKFEDMDDLADLHSLANDYGGHDLYHTGLINRAFFPMRITLMALGRWPLFLKQVSCKSRRKQNKLGQSDFARRPFIATKVDNYDASLKSPLWIYFGVTTLFLFFVLVMNTVGFFDFFLEWSILPGNHWGSLEKTIFRDNLVVFLLVWGCLVHSTVSSFSLLINRKRVARILNFWNVAADELLIDEVNSLRRFLVASNVGYILFLVLLFFSFSSWDVRLIRDGAKLVGILTIKPILRVGQLDYVEDWELRIFGIVAIIYAIYASRSFLFIFCFKCRLLRSLFRLWNARLVKFLRKPDTYLIDKKEIMDSLEKMECQRLLTDMTILLKLVKQVDKMFATILQAYYGVQLLNMCFELYMLAKSGSEEFTKTTDESSRDLDIITAALTLCQNIYFFFTVSLDGAYVGEEAAKGQEALRRYHVTPQTSIHKKYLICNLAFIYNQKITLTGGKFFIIDRPFIITVLGAVLTYFVIIMQVEPSLAKNGRQYSA